MREVSTKRVNVAGIDYSFGDQLGKGSQPGRGFEGFGRWAGSSGYSSPTKSPLLQNQHRDHALEEQESVYQYQLCMQWITAWEEDLRDLEGEPLPLQWGLSEPGSPQWRALLYSAPTKSPIIFSSPRPTSRYLQFMPWARTRYLPENPPCYHILDISSSCLEERSFTNFQSTILYSPNLQKWNKQKNWVKCLFIQTPLIRFGYAW